MTSRGDSGKTEQRSRLRDAYFRAYDACGRRGSPVSAVKGRCALRADAHAVKLRRMLRRVVLASACGVLLGMSAPELAAAKPKAKPKLTKEEKAFRERLASLKKDPANVFNIRMAATDDPSAIPGSASSQGLVMVAGSR